MGVLEYYLYTLQPIFYFSCQHLRVRRTKLAGQLCCRKCVHERLCLLLVNVPDLGVIEDVGYVAKHGGV